MINNWDNKFFWEYEFISENKIFNYKKAMSYFNRSNSTIWKQAKKLNLSYEIKYEKINHIHWNDKSFWEQHFITNTNTFDYNKAMVYFNCKEPVTRKQLKKLKIDYTNIRIIIDFQNWSNPQFWEQNFINNGFIDYKKAMNYFNKAKTSIIKQLIFLKISRKLKSNRSMSENVIIEYITKQYNYELILNSKEIIYPLELDIYIPMLNLAIEFNGNYWHSYHLKIGHTKKQKDYNYSKYRHQLKSIDCFKKNIRLLHLFEYQSFELQKQLIDKFFNYKITEPIEGIYSLDNGCFPIFKNFILEEPEEKIVEKNRTIWNAGIIHILN